MAAIFFLYTAQTPGPVCTGPAVLTAEGAPAIVGDGVEVGETVGPVFTGLAVVAWEGEVVAITSEDALIVGELAATAVEGFIVKDSGKPPQPRSSRTPSKSSQTFML